MSIDVRGRLDHLATRVRPLAYLLAVQDRYEAVRGSVTANSIALNAFLALFAVTLLGVAAVGFLDVNVKHFGQHAVDELGVTGGAAKIVTDAIDTARDSRRLATIFGFLGLISVGTGLAGSVTNAYNTAWGVKGRGLADRAYGLVWIVGALLALGAGAYLTTLWSGADSAATVVATVVGSLLVNFVGWILTSWWLPNRRIPLRIMVPAAATGAVALEILKLLGAVIVPRLVANASELWGTIGTVFALLAWLLLFSRVVVYVTVIESLRGVRQLGSTEVTFEAPLLPR